jgi:hypothetical protein
MKRLLSLMLAISLAITLQAFTITNHSSLTSSMASGTLIPGEFYQISDRNSVTLQAISTKDVSNTGPAQFFVADYQGVGNYYPGLGTQLGQWEPTISASLGSICIYNGLHWRNSSGTSSNTPPPSDPTNWYSLPKQTSNGYKLEINTITLDYPGLDSILVRQDNRGNYVEKPYYEYEFILDNPIDQFQWGNDSVYNNTVKQGAIYCLNNQRNVFNNKALSGGLINAELNQGYISNNTTSDEGILDFFNNTYFVYANTSEQGGNIIARDNSGFISLNVVRSFNSEMEISGNSGKIDANLLFQGHMAAENNGDTARIAGITMFHGSSVNINNNKGVCGAWVLTIGATVLADNNEGTLRWLTLSNTSTLDVQGNKGTVERLKLDGFGTLHIYKEKPFTAHYLEVVLKDGQDFTVLPITSQYYEFYKPFNLK